MLQVYYGRGKAGKAPPPMASSSLHRKWLRTGCSPRLLVRRLLVLCCAFTCFFQVCEFVKQFLQYDTAVSTQVEFIPHEDLPSISICNVNIFRRSVLCPENGNKTYCHLVNEMPNWKTEFAAVRHFSTEQMFNFSHQASDAFVQCYFNTKYTSVHRLDVCQKAYWIFDSRQPCLVVNAGYDDQERPVPNIGGYTGWVMQIDLQPKEYVGEKATLATLYVHDVTTYPTSDMRKGVIRMGFYHIFTLNKITQNFLEYPYKTNCKNYTKQYLKTGSGPQSHNMCYYECLWRFYISKCGCIPHGVVYDRKQIKCQENQSDYCQPVPLAHSQCLRRCPVDCKTELYQIVTSYNPLDNNTEKAMKFIQRGAYAKIELQSVNHVIYTHSPRFTFVELFSYVGGYFGIWLGLSVPLMFDYVTNSITVVHNCLTNRKKRKHKIRILAF